MENFRYNIQYYWRRFMKLFKKEYSVDIDYPIAPEYKRLSNGEFPIKAGYAFYDPYMTREQFEWVIECGFNVIGKSLSINNFDRLLDMAKSYDNIYVGAGITHALSDSVEVVRDRVNKYINNPKIYQFGLYDEPKYNQFEDLKKYSEIFDNLPQNGSINLYPDCGKGNMGIEDYRQYVSDFVKIVNPPFISYDAYPITIKGNKLTLNEVEWNTLEVIKEVADKSKRSFVNFILTNKHWSYPKPEKRFISFQIYAALAYGSQMITTWTYLPTDYDLTGTYTDFPIDFDGTRTDTWYMLKEVLTEFKKHQHIFLGSEVIAVSHTGYIPKRSRKLTKKRLPKSIKKITSDKYGLVVSYIKKDNKEYVLIVSKDINETQNVSIKYKNGSKENISLEPGDFKIIYC